MKSLKFIPVVLLVSLPVAAQESVEIKRVDGTTVVVGLDELLELAPAGVAPIPVAPGAPSVSVTNTDTGVVAEITMAPVVGQDSSSPVLGEDAARPVTGDAPLTGVIVGITEPPPAILPTPAPPFEELTFPGMNFETNKYAITPDGMKRVAVVAQIMKEHPELRVQVTGHTDDVGSEEDNLILSQNRARSFRQALIDNYGIDPNRITTHGLGESEPSHDNATEEGRYANRRIVVKPL